MRNPKSIAKYTFCIDTDTYAGNIERDLCAYCTGEVGECGVGEDYAKMFIDSFGPLFEGIIDSLPDDNGCHRPTSLGYTPGVFQSGELLWVKGQEAQALEAYKKYMIDYYRGVQAGVQKVKDRLLAGEQVPGGWTVAVCDRDINRNQREIDKIEVLTEAPVHEAPNTVEIYFSQQPDESAIQLMKERALEFAALDDPKEYKKPFKINGFRLMKATTTVEEVEIPYDADEAFAGTVE